MSNECENDQHDQCDGDECACPCHAEIADATRAIDDVLERSAGTVTTRDPRTIPHGPLSAWEMDKRSPERSYYAATADGDLYHPTEPEFDEDAAARERAESLGMGRVARILDTTRRALNGEKVPKGKPSGRCSKGGHPVEINALSTVDQIGYRRDGQCPDCRAGAGTFRLRWPFRLFGRGSR